MKTRNSAISRGGTRAVAAVAGVLVSVLASGTCAAQTLISLRGSMRAEATGAVKVSDVAVVTGDDAERIGSMTIAPNASGFTGASGGTGWAEYSLDDLRAFLESQKVNLGRTTLRGSSCSVRVGESTVAKTDKAQPFRGDKGAGAKTEATAVDFSGPATIRHSIASAVAEHLNVAVEDVRIAFEAKDAAFLDERSQGRRVDVQPTASAASEVLPLRVYVYTQDRLVRNETVSIRALVRREQVTASRTIDRRTTIDESMLVKGEAWVSPSAPAAVTLEQALGTVSRNRIAAGQVLTGGVIEQPVLIKKGDKAEVHCLSGTVTLKALRARAMSDGREGEYIEFQVDGSKRSFSARVSGRGLAIATVGGAETQ